MARFQNPQNPAEIKEFNADLNPNLVETYKGWTRLPDPMETLNKGFQSAQETLQKGGILGKPTLESIQGGIDRLKERIATEGITDASGKILQAPTKSVSPATPDAAPGFSIPATVSPVTSATEALGTLGLPDFPSIEEVTKQIPQISLDDILNKPKMQLETLSAERQRQEIERGKNEQLQQTRNDFEKRGLFFSGMREGSEKSIQADALSKKLGIDERLAGILIDASDAARKESIDAAEKLIKAAKDDRGDAINQLNKLGFAVLPDGKIVQTPEAIRAEEDQERQRTNDFISLLGKQGLTVDPLTGKIVQSLAGERNEIAEANLQIAAARAEFSQAATLERLGIAQQNLNIAMQRLALAQEKAEDNQNFTDTQIAQGASVAEIPIGDFKRLSVDDQNFFINRGNDINTWKENIADLLDQEVHQDDVEQFVAAMQIPNAVKDTLGRYRTKKVKESGYEYKKAGGLFRGGAIVETPRTTQAEIRKKLQEK